MGSTAITNCRIIDGTGSTAWKGSILIREGKIEKISRGSETFRCFSAETRIDGEGLTALPGFIDTHSHNDSDALSDPVIAPKLLQGITTEIMGQDGLSLAPVIGEPALWATYLHGFYGESPGLSGEVCSGTGGYLDALERTGSMANYGYLVPHGNLRFAGMEDPGGEADSREVEKMALLLREELDQGAMGWSTGLIYPPCCFASLKEMSALAEVAARAGKPFAVHQRSESDDILASMGELFGIAEKSGVHLHLSHFKICGFHNAGLLDQVLGMIDAAPSRGISFSMDIYPYTAGSTAMSAMLPPWMKTGSPSDMLEKLKNRDIRARISQDMKTGLPGWDNFVSFAGFEKIYVGAVKNEESRYLVGKSLCELGELMNATPEEALFDLLIREENQVTMVDYYTEERILEALLARKEANLCTDGLLKGSAHPRTFGAFPRFIRRFVREKGLLSLEEAVNKMTLKGAEVFGIHDRGVLEEGKAADLLLVQEDLLEDRGTFTDPAVHPAGITGIFINGEPAVFHGQVGDPPAGKTLRI